MFRIALAVAFAALALAPASASADAVCSLSFDVRFDGDGRFAQDGTGTGSCAGNVAGVALDPAWAEAGISGLAASAGGGCLQTPETGKLVVLPRRSLEMWSPEHLELAGDWRAVGGALSGTLITGSTALTITGTLGFTGDCSDSGRLNVEILLGNERPAPRSAPATAPAAAQPASQAATKPKAKARPRKRCAKAKVRSRAAKRCRRAARRA